LVRLRVFALNRTVKRTVTGYVGRVDATGMRNATINFIGDGRLLRTYHLRADDMPTPINVFVEGVRQLRIEVTFVDHSGNVSVQYALSAFLE